MCFRLLQLFSDILDAVHNCPSCSLSLLNHQHDKAPHWTHALPQPSHSTDAILLDVKQNGKTTNHSACCTY